MFLATGPQLTLSRIQKQNQPSTKTKFVTSSYQALLGATAQQIVAFRIHCLVLLRHSRLCLLLLLCTVRLDRWRNRRFQNGIRQRPNRGIECEQQEQQQNHRGKTELAFKVHFIRPIVIVTLTTPVFRDPSVDTSIASRDSGRVRAISTVFEKGAIQGKASTLQTQSSSSSSATASSEDDDVEDASLSISNTRVQFVRSANHDVNVTQRRTISASPERTTAMQLATEFSSMTMAKSTRPPSVAPQAAKISCSKNTDYACAPKLVAATVVRPGRRANELKERSPLKELDMIATGPVPATAMKSPEILTEFLLHSVNGLLDLQNATPTFLSFAYLRVIYRWIAQNIAYDVKSLYEGTVTSEKCTPSFVFAAKRAVCSGVRRAMFVNARATNHAKQYSKLLHLMATHAGLNMLCVSGWAKGASYTTGDNLSGSSNHAWNLVQLDGAFYCLDATWSAGHTNGREFIRKWQEHYFLTPPELFLYDHFPENPEHQLLESPVTKEEFAQMADLKPDFFEANMRPLSHKRCIITASRNGPNITLDFSIDPNWELFDPRLKCSGRSAANDQDLDKLAHQFRKDKTNVQAIVRPPSLVGDYIITLFAGQRKPGSLSLTGSWVARYLLKVQ